MTVQAGQTPADVFERTLTLDGPLDDDQRARLFEIADKCPVHRTLEAGARVVTRQSAVMEPPCEDEHFNQMDRICAGQA